jgi:hypothetical protein
MEKQTLLLQSLSIQKMRGLPKGLDPFTGLQPHINIFFGKNGSGKSSTAKAIQALIWNDRQTGLQAETTAKVGVDRWIIKLDGGKGLIQRNGTDDTLPGLPAVEVADRYMLALHELILKDDETLVKEIIKESIGGYDLDQAGSQLGYFLGPYRKSTAQYKEWENADGKYGHIRREQEKLKDEEGRLRTLTRTREEGEEAQRLGGWYAVLAGWLETKGKLTKATDELTVFPGSLELVSGDEFEKIEELEDGLNTANVEITDADDEITRNTSTMEETGLPGGGLAVAVLTELEQRIGALENSERDLRVKERELGAALEEETNKLSGIGVGSIPEDWAGITAGDINDVDKVLRGHHRALSEKQALDSLIRTFQKEMTHETGIRSDQLSAGIQVLSSWLQEPEATTVSKWPLWVVVGIAYIAALLTALYHPIGLLSIVFAVLAIYLALKRRPEKETPKQLEYNRLNLPAPAAWDRESVLKAMEYLFGELKNIIWQDKVRERLEVYAEDVKKLAPRLEEIEKMRFGLEARLKVLPDAPEAEKLESFDALYWFLEEVDKWVTAQSNRKRIAGEKGVIVEEIRSSLLQINELLTASNMHISTDGPSARAQLVLLKATDNTWRNAKTAIDHARDKRRIASRQQISLEEKLRTQYTRLAIAVGNKDAVRLLVGQLQAYRQAKEEKEAQTRILAEKTVELQTHSLYEGRRQEMEDALPDKIQRVREELAAKISGLEKIVREIHEIETRVAEKKKESNLESALLEKEEALENLADLYASNLASITGQLILETVKKKTGEDNQPAVFKRAKEIFSRITVGHYELIEPVPGGEIQFRAYDTVLNQGQPLAELSTGTRIQLLLSVRLAFIEEQELGLRLPILADELLATTDDERAQAIIEALAEISREGRQIFYFTAQKEEVYKWRTYLEKCADLSFQICELDGRSNPDRLLLTALPDVPNFIFQSDVPDPAGRSHAEYGQDLRIEPFDLLVGEPGAMHLWYLVEDLIVLAALLRQGISRWGQLSNFIKHRGKLPEGAYAVIPLASAEVGLIERYQEMYRQGRPKPIDRQVLIDSEAISDRYTNEVSDLLEDVKWNPRELMNQLRNKAIRGFQSGSMDRLEEYLLDEGYLDERETIPEDDILLRLQVFLSNSEMGQEDANRFLERVAKMWAVRSDFAN